MRRTQQLGLAILCAICAPLFAVLAVWGCIYWNTVWLVEFIPAVLYVGIAHWSWRLYLEDRGVGRDSGSTGPNTSSYTNYGALGEAHFRTQGATNPRIVEEPYKGWKIAGLTDNGRFIPMVRSFASYGVEDAKMCGLNIGSVGHGHPIWSCTCGFYALKSKSEAAAMLSGIPIGMGGYSALLEVELYGTVMVHSTGYRAQKQRVMAMYVIDTPENRRWREKYPAPATEWYWITLEEILQLTGG